METYCDAITSNAKQNTIKYSWVNIYIQWRHRAGWKMTYIKDAGYILGVD